MAGNRWLRNLKRVVFQSPDSGLIRLQFASQSRKPFAEHNKFRHRLVGCAIIISARLKSNFLWAARGLRGWRQGEFKNYSRRRKEADSGARNTSASLPRRLQPFLDS